eukprot:5123857-Lingulodinium_polyedra.AAC.1
MRSGLLRNTRLRDILGPPAEGGDLAFPGFDETPQVPSYAMLNAFVGPHPRWSAREEVEKRSPFH